MFRLDHSLFMAHGRNIRPSPRRSTPGGPTEWDVILTEMKAQLYMHCGTLLIRLAKEVGKVLVISLSQCPLCSGWITLCSWHMAATSARHLY